MGKLIIFEGLDGSGKGTQTKLTADRLRQRGADLRQITFPNYQSPSSSLVKMYLGGEFGQRPDDVNAYAVAEHWFGTGRGCSEFAVLTIGAGVGLGLVCNDQLVVGHHGAAGMIGFARLPDGREARGVVESAAIARRVSAVLERPVAYGQIAALAQTDARVAAVLDDVADAVGQLAGLVALVTSPERLLISGDGVALIADRRHRVRSVFGRLSLAYVTPPSLHLAEVGFREWARGAAAVAIRRHMAPLD